MTKIVQNIETTKCKCNGVSLTSHPPFGMNGFYAPLYKTNNVLWIAVIVLFMIVIFQRQCSPIPVPEIRTDTIRDTTYIDTGRVVYLKPEPVYINPGKINPPSENCDTVREQYISVAQEYHKIRYYDTTLHLDSSHVRVVDTVTENIITGRSVEFRLRYPVITNTTITTEPPRRQFYLGGGIGGNRTEFINQFRLGLLYKDRRDRIFILNGNLVNGQFGVDVNSYWKIRLK